jgi:CheY-like chemotaxis protein
MIDIQLLLLDVYEATRRIKADPGLEHIPIIQRPPALSGHKAEARSARPETAGGLRGWAEIDAHARLPDAPGALWGEHFVLND